MQPQEPHGAVLRAAARAGRPARGSRGDAARRRRGSCTRNSRPVTRSHCPRMSCASRSMPSSASGRRRCARATRWSSSRRWPAAEDRRCRRSASPAPRSTPRPLRAALTDPACGGFASFEGWVRDHNEGQRVRHLEYEAFEALAVREGERIVAEAIARFGVTRAACVHRLGDLAIGEVAVWVGASAPHRNEAFLACRYIIDEVKHRAADLEEGALPRRRFRLGQLRALCHRAGGVGTERAGARAPLAG